jgi:hypothetical protein
MSSTTTTPLRTFTRDITLAECPAKVDQRAIGENLSIGDGIKRGKDEPVDQYYLRICNHIGQKGIANYIIEDPTNPAYIPEPIVPTVTTDLAIVFPQIVSSSFTSMPEDVQIQIIRRDVAITEAMRHRIVKALIGAWLSLCIGPEGIRTGVSLIGPLANKEPIKLFHRLLEHWKENEKKSLVSLAEAIQNPVWPSTSTVDDFQNWTFDLFNKIRGTTYEISHHIIMLKFKRLITQRFSESNATMWIQECRRLTDPAQALLLLFDRMREEEAESILVKALKPSSSVIKDVAFPANNSKAARSGPRVSRQPSCRICKQLVSTPDFPHGAHPKGNCPQWPEWNAARSQPSSKKSSVQTNYSSAKLVKNSKESAHAGGKTAPSKFKGFKPQFKRPAAPKEDSAIYLHSDTAMMVIECDPISTTEQLFDHLDTHNLMSLTLQDCALARMYSDNPQQSSDRINHLIAYDSLNDLTLGTKKVVVPQWFLDNITDPNWMESHDPHKVPRGALYPLIGSYFVRLKDIITPADNSLPHVEMHIELALIIGYITPLHFLQFCLTSDEEVAFKEGIQYRQVLASESMFPSNRQPLKTIKWLFQSPAARPLHTDLSTDRDPFRDPEPWMVPELLRLQVLISKTWAVDNIPTVLRFSDNECTWVHRHFSHPVYTAHETPDQEIQTFADGELFVLSEQIIEFDSFFDDYDMWQVSALKALQFGYCSVEDTKKMSQTVNHKVFTADRVYEFPDGTHWSFSPPLYDTETESSSPSVSGEEADLDHNSECSDDDMNPSISNALHQHRVVVPMFFLHYRTLSIPDEERFTEKGEIRFRLPMINGWRDVDHRELNLSDYTWEVTAGTALDVAFITNADLVRMSKLDGQILFIANNVYQMPDGTSWQFTPLIPKPSECLRSDGVSNLISKLDPVPLYCESVNQLLLAESGHTDMFSSTHLDSLIEAACEPRVSTPVPAPSTYSDGLDVQAVQKYLVNGEPMAGEHAFSYQPYGKVCRCTRCSVLNYMCKFHHFTSVAPTYAQHVLFHWMSQNFQNDEEKAHDYDEMMEAFLHQFTVLSRPVPFDCIARHHPDEHMDSNYGLLTQPEVYERISSFNPDTTLITPNYLGDGNWCDCLSCDIDSVRTRWSLALQQIQLQKRQMDSVLNPANTSHDSLKPALVIESTVASKHTSSTSSIEATDTLRTDSMEVCFVCQADADDSDTDEKEKKTEGTPLVVGRQR